MERLTMTSDKGGVAFTFDLDITCKPSEAQKILKLAQKLKEYEDAEEQGLLFKMPCKPGDIVWILISSTKEIKSFKVSKITIGKNHDTITMTDKSIFTVWGKNWNEYFNHFMFATKEEAEQALARMEKKNV